MSNRFDYKTCEPFRAWNRLEPRTRKVEFDQSMRAEIHDPLWMLARQWQFGEFKGEDTGSAIFAKIQIEHTRIHRFKAGKGSGPVSNYESATPLEKTVEAIAPVLGYKDRVRAGQYFIKLLKKLVEDSNLSPGYEQTLAHNFAIEVPELVAGEPQLLHIEKMKLRSNEKLMHFLSVFAGKCPDGVLLYKSLKHNTSTITVLLNQDGRNLTSINSAVNTYIQWYEDCFGIIPETENESWNPQQLEYQFSCSLPENNQNNTVLSSDEYYSGYLDWYSFDVDKDVETNSALVNDSSVAASHVSKETFSFIPTEASYGGMPNSRWWEFEDGKVDLGNITSETTDIAKVVVAEYALVYGNDWFVVPYALPLGSLSKINGLIVTDVFGEKTLVEAASQGETDDWATWGFFNLSTKPTTIDENSPCDTRLFLPPTLIRNQESQAIEEVLLLRDEMANMVWAIETKVNDLVSQGMDGHALANELHIMLHGEDAPPMEADEKAVLKYMLGNTVRENWIPFIAIHIANQNRTMQLQRASFPRELESQFIPIRPRTQIMRYGFIENAIDQLSPFINPNADDQKQPYFLNNEEVPKEGIIVAGTYQRTRWLNGKIIKWYGYRKQVGKGEASSGLQFDKIQLLKKSKPEIIE